MGQCAANDKGTLNGGTVVLPDELELDWETAMTRPDEISSLASAKVSPSPPGHKAAPACMAGRGVHEEFGTQRDGGR
jgi:hypothetical protein